MTRFFFLSASGNDFLALVEPPETPSRERIAAWCARGVSLGADGLFLLRRDPEGLVMEHFNADGGAADLCLNGTRCAAELAFHLGWERLRTTVLTGAGRLGAQRVEPSRIQLQVPFQGLRPRRVELADGERTWRGWQVEAGVPHLVLPWEGSLADAPVREHGPGLRRHPDLGPTGANVDFVRWVSSRELEIRTWERGVEAETLSCGSGVLAAAAAGLEEGAVELPLDALTRGGFRLRVERRGEVAPAAWLLTGDARVVAEGVLHPGAEVAPRRPSW